MSPIEQLVATASESPLVDWQQRTAQQVAAVAGILGYVLMRRVYADIREIQPVNPREIVPFDSLVYPADAGTLECVFPGYTPPTREMIAEHSGYANSPENYGTAPGEAAALLVQITRALKPETAFVFGTGRGRLEYLIGSNSEAEIVTIDMPSVLVDSAPGAPDTNNRRYRNGLGISEDSQIGDLCSCNPELSGRFHQLLGDAWTFSPAQLADTIRLIVVDGNHQLENCLMDLAHALALAHMDGGVIVVDDFRKKVPFNASVDAAVTLFSRITGLPALTPSPRPNESGLQAAVAIIVVPSGYDKPAKVEKLNRLRKNHPESAHISLF